MRMSTQRGLSYPPISGRHIIFSGIAGACQISGLNKEDVIIADCIYGYKYGKIGGGFKSRGNWTFKTDLGLMTGAIGIHGNPGVLLETDMTAFLPNYDPTVSLQRSHDLVIPQVPKVQLPIVVPGRLPQVQDTIQ